MSNLALISSFWRWNSSAIFLRSSSFFCRSSSYLETAFRSICSHSSVTRRTAPALLFNSSCSWRYLSRSLVNSKLCLSTSSLVSLTYFSSAARFASLRVLISDCRSSISLSSFLLFVFCSSNRLWVSSIAFIFSCSKEDASFDFSSVNSCSMALIFFVNVPTSSLRSLLFPSTLLSFLVISSISSIIFSCFFCISARFFAFFAISSCSSSFLSSSSLILLTSRPICSTFSFNLMFSSSISLFLRCMMPLYLLTSESFLCSLLMSPLLSSVGFGTFHNWPSLPDRSSFKSITMLSFSGSLYCSSWSVLSRKAASKSFTGLSNKPASVVFSITETIVSPGISAILLISCWFLFFSSSNSDLIRRLSYSCAAVIFLFSVSKEVRSSSFSLAFFSLSSSILLLSCIRSCRSASTFRANLFFSSVSFCKRSFNSVNSRRFFASISRSCLWSFWIRLFISWISFSKPPLHFSKLTITDSSFTFFETSSPSLPSSLLIFSDNFVLISIIFMSFWLKSFVFSLFLFSAFFRLSFRISISSSMSNFVSSINLSCSFSILSFSRNAVSSLSFSFSSLMYSSLGTYLSKLSTKSFNGSFLGVSCRWSIISLNFSFSFAKMAMSIA